ncbi:MAG: hypothetical protein JEY99_16145 [Spirochaetales bacterium]|nr:hypothetical protein [Spirochaetales bacterium]
MKKVYRILLILHIFVGIRAIAGGIAAITNPENPLGMPSESLENAPFDSFLIPGIILFTVIGLGNILSAVTFRYKLIIQGYISSVFTWAIVIWIIVQCWMLQDIVFLHVLYLIIGLFGAILSMIILFEKNLFPANLGRYIFKKIF